MFQRKGRKPQAANVRKLAHASLRFELRQFVLNVTASAMRIAGNIAIAEHHRNNPYGDSLVVICWRCQGPMHPKVIDATKDREREIFECLGCGRVEIRRSHQ